MHVPPSSTAEELRLRFPELVDFASELQPGLQGGREGAAGEPGGGDPGRGKTGALCGEKEGGRPGAAGRGGLVCPEVAWLGCREPGTLSGVEGQDQCEKGQALFL